MTLFVYTIKCLKNDKLYVGVTNNIIGRWNKHVYDANHNSRCVIHLAMRKYGIDQFLLSIIKECYSKEELLEQEKFYIQTLKSHVSLGGYNTTWGGEAPMLGQLHSLQTRELISKKLKGRASPNKGNKYSISLKKRMSESHGRSVLQLDVSGKIINTYRSVTKASLATGVATSNISGVCRGKKKTAGGFCWKYSEN